jgi:DNA-binding response OmpR family regulator
MTHSTGKKILIVDDEPDVVAYLRTLLEDNGFQVVTAGNGKEGMERARAEAPALVLLDISMPEESGVRMFRNLQEDAQTSDTPVIIVTGVSHDFKRFIETRRHLRAPAGYFDKPPDREQLLAKIIEILGSKAA